MTTAVNLYLANRTEVLYRERSDLALPLINGFCTLPFNFRDRWGQLIDLKFSLSFLFLLEQVHYENDAGLS